MKKFIIFDFDGTIADTLLTNLKIIEELGLDHGKKITNATVEEFKNVSAMDFLKENGISKIKLYFYFQRIKRALGKRMAKVDIFPGMKEELGKLHKAGFRLGILSSNDKKNIELFLKIHEISDLFDFIFSEKNLFSKDKKLKFVLKYYRLKPENIIYIGDETRDIEAARKVGIKSVAVCWGYDNAKILALANPNALVENPKQIKEVVNSLVQ